MLMHVVLQVDKLYAKNIVKEYNIILRPNKDHRPHVNVLPSRQDNFN